MGRTAGNNLRHAHVEYLEPSHARDAFINLNGKVCFFIFSNNNNQILLLIEFITIASVSG